MSLRARSILAVSLTVAVACGAAGCFFGGPSDNTTDASGPGGPSAASSSSSSGGGAGGGMSATDKDVAQYNALEAQLAKPLTVFSKTGLDGLAAYGTRVFWLNLDSNSPTVHSVETNANKTVDYTFSIGGSCNYNYRASNNLIVTADLDGNYFAYDITQPNTQVGTTMLPPPGSDVLWWAYAPDGNDVYIITTADKTALYKWTPPATTPTMLFNLEDTGATLGEFDDFGVSGNTLVFLADGAVWSLDIAAKKSTYLGNQIEDLTGADIETDGVLFPTTTGLEFYSYTQSKLRDLAAEIQASPYKLNSTYAMAHYVNATRSGYGRFNNQVIYFGNEGLFSYALDTGAVVPVLLDAQDLSTYWANVAVLSNGYAFIQGLQSNDGAIGADGPIYALKLPQ